jgi:hypothetical protein
MRLPRGRANVEQVFDDLERELWLRRRAVAPKPKPDMVILFARENGGGKMELCAQHPTGAVQVISTEP